MESEYDIIKRELEQDIGTGDATTLAIVPEAQTSRAVIRAKQSGVICGLDAAEMSFRFYDQGIDFEYKAYDGDYVQKGTEIACVSGSTRSLLTCERTALNFLQHLSGIATSTRKYVDAMGETSTELLDTRKTTPGMRFFQKCAVLAGGGTNHRMGLDEMILVKDNHIEAAGGIIEALIRVKAACHSLKTEVECKTKKQVIDALTEHPDIIMLDNMSPEQAKESIELIDGEAEVEISGGINLDTIANYSHIGADYISVGALTHHIHALDISMDFI